MELLSEIIPDAWFARPGVRVAPGLVGALVCWRPHNGEQTRRWKIVDVEVYQRSELKKSGSKAGHRKKKGDALSSSSAGTPSRFGPGSTCLIRRGPHAYLTVAAGQDDLILVRALEPEFPCDVLRLREASGPARVARVLGIVQGYEDAELNPENGLWIEFPNDKPPRSKVVRTRRVGLASDGTQLLRWYLKSSLSVSQLS